MRFKHRPFMSLNVKMSLAIVFALTLTLGVYMVATAAENFFAESNYLSDKAVSQNIGQAYKGLEELIAEKHVKGTDSEQLQSWLDDHKYTYLYVYDNKQSAFDGGWRVEHDQKTKHKGLTPNDQRKAIQQYTNKDLENISQDDKIDRNIFKTDVRNRIVNFADGPYYVYVDVYKEEHWHSIMSVFKIVLCAFVFIATMLIYNGRELKRIINLSAEVQKITDGDLKAPIQSRHNDEIGKLAESVNTMRDTVLEKLRSEKEAWDANTQLITAMSHDIRTPLTSLIGYLDIIEGEKYSTKEELNKYVDSCRDKAFQLKDLSDKLFQYFLVFGSHENDKELESFDAGILLQQLLTEHTAELINYGFTIDFEYNVDPVNIKVEISGIRRLFDNLFSNILKYGDRRYHVAISACCEDGAIVVRLLNSILASSKKVESNKIGLKTCERICHDMGGRFIYRDEGQLFTATVCFPIYNGELLNDVGVLSVEVDNDVEGSI